MFTLVDWAVLAAYLLFSLFIGLWVSRGNKNLKEYMFGGGSMPWVAVGISLIATSVSATTFLGAPADVYGDNMTFLMFQIGALLSIVVVGFVFIPRFRTSGINSAYELFELRFSRPVRRLAAVFYCLHLLLRTGILLYAPSLVLAQILHVDLKVAIVVSAAVAIFYTWFGGIKAVIWTDVMQFCVFFALFAATQQGSLLKNALFFTGLFTGPLLGMFLLAFFADKLFGTGSGRLRAWVVIASVLCGMGSLILIQGIPAFGVPALLGGIFSWPWMPFISMTTTVVVALAVNAVANLISRVAR